jgi:repressor LexA
MIKLTQRQAQILNIIHRSLQQTGFPPTRAEIAAELKFKSVNAAEEHLQALAKKGVIEIVPGISRGIKLVKKSGSLVGGESYLGLLVLPLVTKVKPGDKIPDEVKAEKTFQVDVGLFSDKPDYLLKVSGDAMKGAGICDGDYVAIKKADTAKNNQIALVDLGEELAIRRMVKKGKALTAVAENLGASVGEAVSAADVMSVEGVMVGLIRRSA